MNSDDIPVKRLSEDEQTDNVLDVVESLNNVDEKALQAKLNETSISYNNGGRIELDRSMMVKRPPTQGIFIQRTPFEKIDPKED